MCVIFFLFFSYSHYRSCECNANGNGTQSTTVNPNRNNGNNANAMPVMSNGNGGASALAATAAGSNAPATTCSCGNLMNPSNGGNANAFNININNGAYNDGSAANNADTLLSSNAKFQAISAIAVSQDGVINVADQGMYQFSYFIHSKRIKDRKSERKFKARAFNRATYSWICVVSIYSSIHLLSFSIFLSLCSIFWFLVFAMG